MGTTESQTDALPSDVWEQNGLAKNFIFVFFEHSLFKIYAYKNQNKTVHLGQNTKNKTKNN